MPTVVEEIQATGSELLQTVKNVIRAGNVRRIVIKNGDGRTVLDVPLTAGIVGVLLLPLYASIASIAMLAARWTVVVEREAGPPAPIPH
ncbi:DUF4342 domain-containing protein [Roseisolibacter sp. H3M3-2]|uniref:DUF4342 domain-containing protein n=1 Tax=Roseisolibacter sp. H3M3-2 TaxID=3031323 RepID=UPI0023DBD174|nr:DUF4342 domain-containing protein [Roseisolibacter sp. H3M3-2]MDF1502424.1 DUF4342 domain-containing protein [Roseisolibacter sp. H3M3-2]